MYEERFYRKSIYAPFTQELAYKESDLLICTDKNIKKFLLQDFLEKYYKIIENYIKVRPEFITSLSPISDDSKAQEIIREMIKSGQITGVGPMASVAGAIAKYIGKDLLKFTQEIIIENGGDIFLKINEPKTLGVYLGERFKIKELNLEIKPRAYAFGIASSSAFIGHSLNFGKADLVTIIAKDAILADSYATALANQVKKKEDIEKVVNIAKKSNFIEAIIIAFSGKLFIWGDIKIKDN